MERLTDFTYNMGYLQIDFQGHFFLVWDPVIPI